MRVAFHLHTNCRAVQGGAVQLLVEERRSHMTSGARFVAAAVVAVGCLSAAPRAADYPLNLVAPISMKSGDVSVTSNVAIKVDRVMEESRRVRVTDALKYKGYLGFVPALRALPVIGSIEVSRRKADIKYAVETKDEKGPRIVLVADRPLFFVPTDAERSKAGYELTIVELRLTSNNTGTGFMTGAARVKLAPDGTVILDDYADALVQLTIGK
jgi:hypothetical protein